MTAISKKAHRAMESPPLTLPRRTLRGPSSTKVLVKGKFTETTRVHRNFFFFAENLHRHLFGHPAIAALDLVVRVRSVHRAKSTVDGYCEHWIQLEEGTKPFALTVPRRVTILLMQPVKNELARKERLGVITTVSEPTDWCAGIVVVPKDKGKVHLCMDLTHPNKSVRQGTSSPSCRTISCAARVFSTIPLDRESALLTTFVTPFGRYCFSSFNISALEHFQRQMSDILTRLHGVVCMMSLSMERLPRNIMNAWIVLQRLRVAGLTLNKKNTIPRGQIVDSDGIHPDLTSFKKFHHHRFLGTINHLSKVAPNQAEDKAIA